MEAIAGKLDPAIDELIVQIAPPLDFGIVPAVVAGGGGALVSLTGVGCGVAALVLFVQVEQARSDLRALAAQYPSSGVDGARLAAGYGTFEKARTQWNQLGPTLSWTAVGASVVGLGLFGGAIALWPAVEE